MRLALPEESELIDQKSGVTSRRTSKLGMLRSSVSITRHSFRSSRVRVRDLLDQHALSEGTRLDVQQIEQNTLHEG